jgi:hypothetical protein
MTHRDWFCQKRGRSLDAFFGRASAVLICHRRAVVAADHGQFIDANAEFLLVAVNVPQGS